MVKIEAKDGKLLTTSLSIANTFGKHHKNVIRDLSKLKCSDEFSGLNYEPTYYIDLQGREQPNIAMTKDGFMLLVMGYSGTKFTRLKELYINQFNKMEKQLNQTDMLALPKDYLSALKSLVVNEEEKLLLEAENEEMKPKAAFYDRVASSESLISMQETAKILDYEDMGQNNLFRFLKDKKVLMDEKNMPYQKYISWFKVIEQTHVTPKGKKFVKTKTMVKQKGLDGIRRLLDAKISEDIIKVIEG